MQTTILNQTETVSYKELIEEHLHKLLPSLPNTSERLTKAARYALLNGGKRLRPLLTLATLETLGCNPIIGLNAACAIEMVHAYSLIHDDLPCMDDDDFRRGKPTVHKAYDEGTAVLTGDYLLTHAFKVITDDPLLSADQKVELVSILSEKAGGSGMIGGQILDLRAEGLALSQEALEEIHRKKTGAMIVASIEFGAIVGNATPQQRSKLTQFGENVGLAFQIIDDVIDITDSENKHGKAVSSDTANNKTTYVTLLGVEKAKQQAERLLILGLSELSCLGFQNSFLAELAKSLVYRKL